MMRKRILIVVAIIMIACLSIVKMVDVLTKPEPPEIYGNPYNVAIAVQL